MQKPHLYQGHPLPLSQMTPDKFEDFVYVAMSEIGKEMGFALEAGRQKSTDGGFDCTARDSQTQGIICIQCKRYAAALGTDTLADEVVKIALNGILQNDTPEQHFIITTGDVAKTTRAMMRQNSFSDLKKKCEEVLSKGYITQINALKMLGLNPVKVVCDYIDAARIIVWSAVDFDNELTRVWQAIIPLLDRFFAVDVVVREYPRANFDIHQYRAHISNAPSGYTELSLSQSQTPENIRTDNQAHCDNAATRYSYSDFIHRSSMFFSAPGKILISCPGGSGKTIFQQYIRFHLLEERSDYLPVIVALNTYSRGGLDKSIESSLGISWGSWRSLPSRFVFLFDGLDEMQESDVSAFVNELQVISAEYPCIITVRDTGLRIPATINGINLILRIEPLTYRQIINIARAVLPQELLYIFYGEMRLIIQQPQTTFLRSPFGLTNALDFFQKNSALPKVFSVMLDAILKEKIIQSRSRITSADTVLNKLDNFTIVSVMAVIVYEIRIGFGAYVLEEDKLSELASKVNLALNGDGILFTFPSLVMFTDFITKFEVLKKVDSIYIFTEHNILLDHLLAKRLKKNWRELDRRIVKCIGRDAWHFVGELISPPEAMEFLNFILEQDLICGATIAKAFGAPMLAAAETLLLEQEQSPEIMVRSAAMVALGVLGTEGAVARLHSKLGVRDYQHKGQRLVALARSGDIAVLQYSLDDSSGRMQFASKISGGEYQIWWSGPVAVITALARQTLRSWQVDERVLTCLASDTLRFYGDDSDLPLLEAIVAGTQSAKDLYSALYAIRDIAPTSLITVLYNSMITQNNFRFILKKTLFELGEAIDFEEELNVLIACLDDDKLFYSLGHSYLESRVDVLKHWPGLVAHESRLFAACQQSKRRADFVVYAYLWSIASVHQLTSFADVALDAIKSDKMDTIMYALSFLNASPTSALLPLCADFIAFYERNITRGHNLARVEVELIRLIDKCADRTRISQWLNGYLESFFPQEKRDKFAEDDITYAFSLSHVIATIAKYADDIDVGIINKIILLDCKAWTEIDNYQRQMVNALTDARATELLELAISSQSVPVINNYLAKLLVGRAHLLTKALTISLIPSLLSFHMWHHTLFMLVASKWDDEVADAFLKNMIEMPWNSINAQMFEGKAGEFSTLLSARHLDAYTDYANRVTDPRILRIFQLWIEVARDETPSP
mgnify:CR=1 FL=1